MSNRPYRQRRGQATAVLVAEYLQPIAPGATATSSAYSGNDMQHVPWDVEVKAPREESWTHAKPGADHHVVLLQPEGREPFCGVCEGRVRRKTWSPRAALRQAARRRKPEHVLPPMVVFRPDGTGDKSVGDFVVMRRFEDDRAILAELIHLRGQMRKLGEAATLRPVLELTDDQLFAAAWQARRALLEYTEEHGWMSQAAKDELEARRAQD